MSDFSQNKNSRTAQRQPSCVRCGYCCSKGVCVNGMLIVSTQKCAYLKIDDEDLGTFSCTLRDKIIEAEKDSKTPMFDNYCTSSVFNTVRDAVIKKMI